MLKRLVKEPLVHFLLLAVVIFAVYGLINREWIAAPDRIVVTTAKIEQLVSVFAKTWQRPPTAEELKGLIDDYVKEEIYVREASALGLDKDDTVIRRRLRLKMEFLNEVAADALAPTDAELEAYLQANAGAFEIDPMLAFQQVFLSPDRHGDKIDQDAASILEVLLTSPTTDPASLGDSSLLPTELSLTTKTSIGQTFGADFADALDKAALAQWTGPIKSAYGLHLIRVLERKPGRLPALDEVRDAVAREWANARRKELEDRRFEELLKNYEVTIESLAGSSANP